MSSQRYTKVLGDAAVTIPTVGAIYTDAKTVAAVQQALVNKGYDLGATGPAKNGVDGVFGPKTKTAIKNIQSIIGETQNGQIDVGVIMALQVTPGVLPPGVTLAGRAAVQSQVALDAATAAEHAQTPTDVQIAAQQVAQVAAAADADAASSSSSSDEAYGPPLPPAVKKQVQAAVAQAQAATTPAQVQAAAVNVQAAALAVNESVAPSWWKMPAWSGGIPRWQVAALGAGGIVGFSGLIWVLGRLAAPAAVPVRKKG